MKIAFYTLGCKVNQYETEALAEKFALSGAKTVPFSQKADLYVINTCSVTAESDRKSRQAIARARAKNPDALIAAIGCYPQTAGADSDAFSQADIVLGTAEKHRLFELVAGLADGGGAPLLLSGEVGHYFPYGEESVSGHAGKTRAILKIEDGCDNFCSYCIIPYARGRVRSRPKSEVTHEFERLLENGYPEVVITGIEVASYGKDTGESLAQLLAELDSLAGSRPTRLRLSSLEPRLITPEFVKKIAPLSHLCAHFHLSLQSGCDSVLKRMNRKYDTAGFEKARQTLLDAFPGAGFTTDVIVGFPGETEEEFEKTLEFLKRMKFLKVHVFPYSRRQGTPAARMDGQLPRAEKARRAGRVAALCEGIREEILLSAVGSRAEVLFETCKDGFCTGFTREYMPARAKEKPGLCGSAVLMQVLSAEKDTLFCG